MTTTTDKISPGTYVAMTVTNLQSLANDASSPYACWQSDRVSNVSAQAVDYEIYVSLPTANVAPGNDGAAYVYLVPWTTTDGGATWVANANFGTTTLPTGAEGTASIVEPNSMKGGISIPYVVAQQRLDEWFTVSQLCGICPDGWSLVIRDCTGANLSTGCVVAYRPIAYTNS